MPQRSYAIDKTKNYIKDIRQCSECGFRIEFEYPLKETYFIEITKFANRGKVEASMTVTEGCDCCYIICDKLVPGVYCISVYNRSRMETLSRTVLLKSRN